MCQDSFPVDCHFTSHFFIVACKIIYFFVDDEIFPKKLCACKCKSRCGDGAQHGLMGIAECAIALRLTAWQQMGKASANHRKANRRLGGELMLVKTRTSGKGNGSAKVKPKKNEKPTDENAAPKEEPKSKDEGQGSATVTPKS